MKTNRPEKNITISLSEDAYFALARFFCLPLDSENEEGMNQEGSTLSIITSVLLCIGTSWFLSIYKNPHLPADQRQLLFLLFQLERQRLWKKYSSEDTETEQEDNNKEQGDNHNNA